MSSRTGWRAYGAAEKCARILTVPKRSAILSIPKSRSAKSRITQLSKGIGIEMMLQALESISWLLDFCGDLAINFSPSDEIYDTRWRERLAQRQQRESSSCPLSMFIIFSPESIQPLLTLPLEAASETDPSIPPRLSSASPPMLNIQNIFYVDNRHLDAAYEPD